MNSLEFCYSYHLVTCPPHLGNSLLLKDTCNMEKPYTSVKKGCYPVAATKWLFHIHTYYAYSYKGGLKYSGIGFPTLEFSHVHKTRQIIVQNSISNFQPQHQNRKLASRHFAAKLDPKQKVSSGQRKMFYFCFKKRL